MSNNDSNINYLTRFAQAMKKTPDSPFSIEGDTLINNASRRLIAAVKFEHNQAWLGKLNRTPIERVSSSPIVSWKGGTAEVVRNFSADFVLPAFNREIEQMMLDRERSITYNVRSDVRRVQDIIARTKEVGGFVLPWS